MKILGGIKAVKPGKVLAPVFLAVAIPGQALAGFSMPFHHTSERLGTGAMSLDGDWSLFGLLGLALVVALLAGFYRRDK